MRPITIRSIELYPVALTLVERLRTSFGEEPFKACILVRLETDEGYTGWGECSAEIAPGYSVVQVNVGELIGWFRRLMRLRSDA